MSSKGMTKSAATAKVKSNTNCQNVSPQGVTSVGILLSKQQAIALATKLLVLAISEDIQGDIVMTAYAKRREVTILGYKGKIDSIDSN